MSSPRAIGRRGRSVRAAAPLALFLLAGCGPELEWVRPGYPAAANAAQLDACRAEADDAARLLTVPERIEGYRGGVPMLPGEVPSLPLRAGRGDLVEKEDAARRFEREQRLMAARDANSRVLQDCLRDAGFTARPRAATP
jgi:hypothetical protein